MFLVMTVEIENTLTWLKTPGKL